MNREILFKAKRKDNGEWVEGLPGYDIDGKITELEVYKSFCNCQTHVIDSDTICQYTGLTDKNGRKIWENDIVVCKKCIAGNLVDYCVEIGYVEMKYGAFELHRKQGYYRPFKDWLEDYEYEVIGNIFDNADLLEVE